ncbi:hypothetical protein B4U79_02714 [Dinothrombium tinctorium]|uniref:Uncharacterized protein n=1 Tax=Dinothrombium tinctorium TaxID=1965070 RepID=A0A3S3NUA3_9ACAR|nr:hypothetical protein B4U79_12577 [Dinothrombium tinctorium]RWS06203.1 hypothetical protein B4U79_02714 [Dinothrombium tinctorium]
MDDEKQSDKNNNESIEDQFNPEAEEIASSTASLNTVCERCDYEMRDVIMCDSYEMEARQALRVERTIYDQDEKLKNFFAEVKKHIKEYYFKVLVIGVFGTLRAKGLVQVPKPKQPQSLKSLK